MRCRRYCSFLSKRISSANGTSCINPTRRSSRTRSMSSGWQAPRKQLSLTLSGTAVNLPSDPIRSELDTWNSVRPLHPELSDQRSRPSELVLNIAASIASLRVRLWPNLHIFAINTSNHVLTPFWEQPSLEDSLSAQISVDRYNPLEGDEKTSSVLEGQSASFRRDVRQLTRLRGQALPSWHRKQPVGRNCLLRQFSMLWTIIR